MAPTALNKLDTPQMKWLSRILKSVIILAFIAVINGLIGAVAIYFYLAPGLPEIDTLRDVQFQVPLRVYSEDNKLIAEYGEKRREPLEHDQIPENMIQAVLAAEDSNFYSHPGVDYRGLLRAGVSLIMTGKKKQGGSTITMQVARNFFLTRKKTFTRKLSEIMLALKIEKELSKEEILELYMNKIYLGHRSYGVGAAAKVYYGKDINEISLAQTAMIAGLPKAPSRYNPIANPPRATIRRNYVLGRMKELGYIDEAAYEEALNAPVTAKRHTAKIEAEAPYIAEMVRSDMVERFGQEAYTGGYRVYTTVNTELQETANLAVRSVLDAYSERHGYHGPEARLEAIPEDPEALQKKLADFPTIGNLIPGVITQVDEKAIQVTLRDHGPVSVDWDNLNWARRFKDTNIRGPKLKKAADAFTIGDIVRLRQVEKKEDKKKAKKTDETEQEPQLVWRLAQIPKNASALVALNPRDGAIISLVGGYDFYYSKFNRANQAKRQPGSGFKAFIYSAALENGFTAASVINDAPVVFNDASLEGAWRPENYSGKWFGPTRLRFALTKSRNLISIRLLRSMGIRRALNHIEKFGFEKETLPANLSLALGSANVTPLEMAKGYAVLANGGFLVEPYLIKRIEQNFEDVIYEAEPLLACPSCSDEELEAAAKMLEEAKAKAAAKQTETAGEVQPVEMQENETEELALEEQPPRYAPRVISEENRYIMYSMMQDVIQRGTAVRAKVLGRKDLAGKTGTTNDQRDAWFNGFNQSIVANVWVGFDDNSKLGRGEVGGRAALPAWIDFMKVALKDTKDQSPRMPNDLVTVRIDPKTGLRAPAGFDGAMFEVFRPDHVPEMLPVSEIVVDPIFAEDVSPEEATREPAADLF